MVEVRIVREALEKLRFDRDFLFRIGSFVVVGDGGHITIQIHYVNPELAGVWVHVRASLATGCFSELLREGLIEPNAKPWPDGQLYGLTKKGEQHSLGIT